MKKMKWYFAVALGIVGFHMTTGQTSSKEKGTIIVSEKKDAEIVKHKGITYYMIEGLWHTKLKNKYVLKPAPEGAIVGSLPEGGEKIVLVGKTYYKCKGVFYRKLKTGNGYEVCRP